MREILIAVVAVNLLTLSVTKVFAQNGGIQDPPKEGGDHSGSNRRVKIRKLFGEGCFWYSGEVVKIDEKEMQVRCSRHDEAPKLRVFLPIDVLAKGEVLKESSDGRSYRWQDVQKGDAVDVGIVPDLDEKIDYCIDIMITRRSGGKIPESQKPSKIGVPYHWRANVLNDIDNGLDVPDEEVEKAFPFKPSPIPLGFGPPEAVKPDSLYDGYHRKLEAIREKKAKELKAKPADKK